MRFSKQAEKMISQMNNHEEVKNKLIELAKQREIIISGGDVIKFIIRGELLTCIDPQEAKK